MTEDPGGGARGASETRPGDGPSMVRVWLTGARLHTLPAAAAPVLVGGGLAWAWREFAAGPWLAALVAAGLIQIGTNFANDYSDFIKGADARGRVGFTRITQAGLAPPQRVRKWAAATFSAAVVPGTYLVLVGGWPVLAIGLVSMAAGLAYTAGPAPLAYHGLGDVFVFVFFGLVAVSGTHYVQSLRFEPETLLAGAGVGALCTAILVVNNLRDIESDARAGKRTLAVRLGRRASAVQYGALVMGALLAPGVGVAFLGWSPGALLSWVALVPLQRPLGTVLSAATGGAALEPAEEVEPWRVDEEAEERRREAEALNRALAGTGRALAVYGLLLAVGLTL